MSRGFKNLYQCQLRRTEEEGETSHYIDAEINNEGDIIINGQDVGNDPLEYWGDSGYEFSTYVSAKHEDAVSFALMDKIKDENPEAFAKMKEWKSQDDIIIAAIEILYSGNRHAVNNFQDYMRSVGIDAEFFSWV
ncbi:hypothetical protein ACFLTP_08695 [Chloroflexota bacterium]